MPILVPAHPLFGEGVWEVLRDQLPDEAVLLHSLRVQERQNEYEADIVVLIPGAGWAVIEVEGGDVRRVDGACEQRQKGRWDRTRLASSDSCVISTVSTSSEERAAARRGWPLSRRASWARRASRSLSSATREGWPGSCAGSPLSGSLANGLRMSWWPPTLLALKGYRDAGGLYVFLDEVQRLTEKEGWPPGSVASASAVLKPCSSSVVTLS